MKHLLYKICKKGSKEPIVQDCMSGPLWRNRWAFKETRIYVYDEYMYTHAWNDFINHQKFRGQYKDNVLLFNNKIVAEAFRNPRPKDEYDIYRIRLYNIAPQNLKDWVIGEAKAGRRFVAEYY